MGLVETSDFFELAVVKFLAFLLVDDDRVGELDCEMVSGQGYIFDELLALDSELFVLLQLLDQDVSHVHSTHVLVLVQTLHQFRLQHIHLDRPRVPRLSQIQFVLAFATIYLDIPNVLFILADGLKPLHVSRV